MRLERRPRQLLHALLYIRCALAFPLPHKANAVGISAGVEPPAVVGAIAGHPNPIAPGAALHITMKIGEQGRLQSVLRFG